MKDRLSVARTVVSVTLEEMTLAESLPKFADMSYDEIEGNMYTVSRQVCGLEEVSDKLGYIVVKAKEAISDMTADFTEEDWLTTNEVSLELINQTTLAVYNKNKEL